MKKQQKEATAGCLRPPGTQPTWKSTENHGAGRVEQQSAPSADSNVSGKQMRRMQVEDPAQYKSPPDRGQSPQDRQSSAAIHGSI
jgi:hypothetical protein